MTTGNECDNLDSFLAGELDADAATLFEAHLHACDDCRDATDQQRWIDSLLRSPARLHLESAPTALLESYRTSIALRRRRAQFVACGLAAAAVLVVAVGWTVKLNRQAPRGAGAEKTIIAAAPVKEEKAPRTPRATFVSSGDAIAIPLESASADVTIVQLYPTIETERRWRRELAWQLTARQPDGG